MLLQLRGVYPTLRRLNHDETQWADIRQTGDRMDREADEGEAGGKIQRSVRRDVPGDDERQDDLFGRGDSNAAAEAEAERLLQADRLTAKFNSPLNRGNLRKRIKAGKQPEQGSIFGEAPPEDEQGSMFMRRKQESGAHGPVFRQFRHDVKGAISKLRETKGGDAIAALHHPEVGDIDLI